MSLKDIKERKVKVHGEEYQDRLEQGYRVISPSGASKFLSNPYEWRLNVLDRVQTFTGNTQTCLGTVCHLFMEKYYKDELTKDCKLHSLDVESIISSTSDLDIQMIYKNYPVMCEALREVYLEQYPKPMSCEEYMEYEIKDHKILVAGTVDIITEEDGKIIICDLKTSKSPYKEKKDLAKHLYQLSIYSALLFKNKGITADRFRIVNVSQPTKTIKPRVHILECDVVEELGSNLLNDIVETIMLIDDKPTMKDIIFRENPLNGFTIPNEDSMNSFIDKYIKNFKFITPEVNRVEEIKKNIFA